MEETLFKLVQSLYCELYTPFMKDPDELVEVGEVQMDLFPSLALRKFQLYVRDENQDEESRGVVYKYISDIYKKLGRVKAAEENLIFACRLSPVIAVGYISRDCYRGNYSSALFIAERLLGDKIDKLWENCCRDRILTAPYQSYTLEGETNQSTYNRMFIGLIKLYLQKNKENTEALCALGYTYYCLSFVERDPSLCVESKKTFERILSIDPKHRGASNFLKFNLVNLANFLGNRKI